MNTFCNINKRTQQVEKYGISSLILPIWSYDMHETIVKDMDIYGRGNTL